MNVIALKSKGLSDTVRTSMSEKAKRFPSLDWCRLAKKLAEMYGPKGSRNMEQFAREGKISSRTVRRIVTEPDREVPIEVATVAGWLVACNSDQSITEFLRPFDLTVTQPDIRVSDTPTSSITQGGVPDGARSVHPEVLTAADAKLLERIAFAILAAIESTLPDRSIPDTRDEESEGGEDRTSLG